MLAFWYNKAMSKEVKRKKNKKTAVKFSHFQNFILCTASGILSKILRAKYYRSEAFEAQKKKGAMLVVANHLSAFDFVYFARSMKGAPLNYVVAENMMYSTPAFATLITNYHAITKKQYTADVQCIKLIKRYLDAGISVLICPEGKVSADGTTGTIPSSISKLITWLGYPVGYLKLEGSSIARPKWASNIRKGKVKVNCDMLFSAQDLKEMDKEEVLEKLQSVLSHNEHKWQIENGIKFEGERYAEGLHKLLYHCPKCGEECKMSSHDDHLVCNACGNDVVYSHEGKLEKADENSVTFERIDEWFANERTLMAEEVKKDNFVLSNRVNLFIENAKNNGYRFVAGGVITLDKDTLRFDTNWLARPLGVTSKFGVNAMECDYTTDGTTELVEEEFKHLSFSIKNLDTLAYLPGIALDMYDLQHTYRFMFADEARATKYALAIEEMYKQRVQ